MTIMADKPLTLTDAEREALRRLLYGWTLQPEQRATLDGITGRLGAPRQEPWERVGITREQWNEALAAAIAADRGDHA